jgi:L-glyceraldehyde 3-phosphate reductase
MVLTKNFQGLETKITGRNGSQHISKLASRITIGLLSAPKEKQIMDFSPARYKTMIYNRAGRTGLKLPAISIGLWQNFGANDPFDNQRQMLRTAFDLGITNFDLADLYARGAAEVTVGKLLKTDFRDHRDELIISTKAGCQMWDGPYGTRGSRKHMIAALDQSLKRLQLDYVDVFYNHRPDPAEPLEETAEALADAVRQGKALYVAISNYFGDASRRMISLLRESKTPCVINQVRFNMFDRMAETSGEFRELEKDGVGSMLYSPLAQGLLSGRYLNGIPADSRAGKTGTSLEADKISESLLTKVRSLNEIAADRGQSLAQMALCWNLSFPSVTSVLIGASHPEQITENVAALEKPTFSDDELRRIEEVLAKP